MTYFKAIRKGSYTCIPVAAIAALCWLITPGPKGKKETEHPGYFKQWFEEKKDANGQIPRWLTAQWAAWDKKQVVSRAGGLIDTVIQLGPNNVGGRTRSMWIDPRNENIILAAAISGGVWRSETGGTSWKPLNDQQVSMLASCITSNPFNHDIVYYGTGESRANSADVSGNGVFKSIDGGKTFTQLASTVGVTGFDAIWDIAHSLDNDSTLFVGTHDNGLWRSTNSGATWQRVFNGGSRKVNDILVMPNGVVLISCQGDRMYRSNTGGTLNSFTAVAMPNFPGNGTYLRLQMANCKKFPDVVYMVFEGLQFNDLPVAFYKSSNGGQTWVQKTTPSGFGPSYQAYCLMLGCHPTDSNRVVGGGVNIAQTSDGGNSWVSKTTGHSDNHSFHHFNGTTDNFLVGSDGGVHRYRWTSNSSPTGLNTGYNVTQFYAGAYGMDGFNSVGGTQDNGTHVAIGNLSSNKAMGADGAYCHIGLNDGTVAYMSTQNDGIKRKNSFVAPSPGGFTDDISDPRFLQDGVDFINAYAMNPVDQSQLYYRTNTGVYRSGSSGDNWEKMNSTTRVGIKALGVSYDNNPVLYYGGVAAQLYKVENAVNAAVGTEVSYNSSVPAEVTSDVIKGISVSPLNKYTIFVAFNNINNKGRVWKATGLNGASPVWTNISGNLPPNLPVNYVAVDHNEPERILFAATDFGLYHTSDSGKTWIKELRVPNVAVHEVKVRSDKTAFLYTHGRGMWVLGYGGNTSALKQTPGFAKGLRVFPNPAANILNIESAGSQPLQYSILDMSGKVCLEGKISGARTPVSTVTLKNGMYFLRMRNATEQHVSKVIINK